jgi:hypothetical protein
MYSISTARKMYNIKTVHTKFRENLPPGREVEIGVQQTHKGQGDVINLLSFRRKGESFT